MPKTSPDYPPTGEHDHFTERRKLVWGPYTIVVSLDETGKFCDIEEVSINTSFYDPSHSPGFPPTLDLDEFFPDEPEE
ncbi:hypothetical protein LCGC14_1842700 [marine sediment metagenome]|uniref:Uncharacterized protein n=1 Tax=marine sediment metagenome TaxID=412755 RepID=A0A0F9JC08_9ZZZZ